MVKILRKTLKVVSSLVLVMSIGILVKILVIDSYISQKAASEIQELYHHQQDSENNNDSEKAEEDSKFSELSKINSEICGWITVPGTRIDYPVLQGNKNETHFYLDHNYKREKSKYGSIFLDPICQLSENPKNCVIYGHHMADGQMFADLMKFSSLDFYKQNPLISFETIYDRNAKWKIFSVFKTNTLASQGKIFYYVVSDFADNNSFLDYVSQIRKRSLLDIPVDVNENDKLITLSTCSYEFQDFRTVVVARRVRNGEDEAVDTSLAAEAKNPLMPECWYKKHGGSPPV